VAAADAGPGRDGGPADGGAEAFHARINDVLLTALTVAVAKWRGQAAQAGSAVVIDLEGHGREEIFAGVDLSRTVGWFTSLFPVKLDPGLEGLEEPGRALKAIKEQLRQIPDHGLGYGILRYLNRGRGRFWRKRPPRSWDLITSAVSRERPAQKDRV